MKSRSLKVITTIVAVICTVAMLSTLVFAVPATNIQRDYTQPSGEKFKGTKVGDEWANGVEAEDGSILVKGLQGNWVYARIESDTLVPSTSRYKIDAKPEKTVKKAELASSAAKAKKAAEVAPQLVTPQSGTQPMIVILVEFTDISFIYGDSLWRDSFFGGVNNYYAEASHGKFQFSPAAETQGTANDGIIKVKLNYAHPNTADAVDDRNQKIVKDALTAADPYINYAAFDTNGDGAISRTELHVSTVVAGYEAAYDYSIPQVWAHSWSLAKKNATTLDGKKLCDYATGGGYVQQGERHGDHMATIGTLVHELGHDISCPDLYDYGYDSDGVGIHSIMAGGSWARVGNNPHGSSPVHFDAYNKVGLGWITPITVPTGTNTYTLNAAYLSTENILKIPTSVSTQYFLVQNRQFKGYDAGLTYDCLSGSDGILILHVDTTISNNDTETRKMVDVEEANEGTLGYSQLDNCTGYGAYEHYYKSGVNTTFGPSTTPNSALYSGATSNVTISVPGTASDAMSVTVTR